MHLFGRQRKRKIQLRPDSQEDRERLLRKLATSFGNGELTLLEYEKYKHKVETCWTAAQVQDVMRVIATGTGVVSAIATVVGITFGVGQGDATANGDPHTGVDHTNDAAVGNDGNGEYNPDIRYENDGVNQESQQDNPDAEGLDDCDDGGGDDF